MNQNTLLVILQQARGRIVTAINESGLTPELADLVLSSVLSDVRGQENLELLNHSKSIEAQLQKMQKGLQEAENAKKPDKVVKING